MAQIRPTGTFTGRVPLGDDITTFEAASARAAKLRQANRDLSMWATDPECSTWATSSVESALSSLRRVAMDLKSLGHTLERRDLKWLGELADSAACRVAGNAGDPTLVESLFTAAYAVEKQNGRELLALQWQREPEVKSATVQPSHLATITGAQIIDFAKARARLLGVNHATP